MKDAFGVEVAVGDYVAHANRRGSSMWLDKKLVVCVQSERVQVEWESGYGMERQTRRTWIANNFVKVPA